MALTQASVKGDSFPVNTEEIKELERLLSLLQNELRKYQGIKETISYAIGRIYGNLPSIPEGKEVKKENTSGFISLIEEELNYFSIFNAEMDCNAELLRKLY